MATGIPQTLCSGPIPIEGEERMGLFNGRKYYWSPKRDVWLLVPKKTKAKKTYLKRIEEVLNDIPMDYDMMIDFMKANWDENKQFNEGYITTALRKGMTLMWLGGKYKGHNINHRYSKGKKKKRTKCESTKNPFFSL